MLPIYLTGVTFRLLLICFAYELNLPTSQASQPREDEWISDSLFKRMNDEPFTDVSLSPPFFLPFIFDILLFCSKAWHIQE
jgi:hypothetical protein